MERLQKLLAQAGIASRRRAEEMILAGRIRVNGQVVNALGAQADPERDTILVDNHPVSIESKAYYVLNKPRGYISDRDDTADNKTALDLVPDGRRLFSAGRLDLMSEGMLLLTNDGELANRLTHPRYEHEKEYLALVFGSPDEKAMERLERGVLYDGEWLRADHAERAGKSQVFGEAGRDETWLRLVLHEGKKRQIRHMCAALGHPVKRLIRVRMGPLVLGNLKPGEWRKLTREEVADLRARSQARAEVKPKSRHKPQYVRRPTSNVKREVSRVERRTSDVRRQTAETRYQSPKATSGARGKLPPGRARKPHGPGGAPTRGKPQQGGDRKPRGPGGAPTRGKPQQGGYGKPRGPGGAPARGKPQQGGERKPHGPGGAPTRGNQKPGYRRGKR